MSVSMNDGPLPDDDEIDSLVDDGEDSADDGNEDVGSDHYIRYE
jgi:hypothetical protein